MQPCTSCGNFFFCTQSQTKVKTRMSQIINSVLIDLQEDEIILEGGNGVTTH